MATGGRALGGRRARSRLTVHDAHFAPLTGVGIVGPTDLPSVDAVREVVFRLAEQQPDHPLFCRPVIGRFGTGRWEPLSRAERDRRCLDMVSELATPVDLDALTHQAAQPVPPDRLLHLAMGDGYVLIAAGHVLGDASLSQLAPQLLLAAMGQQPLPRRFDDAAVRLPLTRAVLRHFGKRPSRLLDAIRTRSSVRVDTRDHEPSAPVDRHGDLSTVTAVARTGTVAAGAALVEWRAAHAGERRLTMGSVLTAATRRAFDRVGLRFTTPGVRVLVNARRYLPPGTPVPGNFTTAIYVEPDDPRSPFAIEEVVRRNLDSGRPLATMAITSVKQVIGGRWASDDGDDAATGPMTLTVSNPGRSVAFEALPLRGDAGHRIASVPEGPGGVTVQLTQLNGQHTATATFHPGVVDRGAVGAALDALVCDPVGLLED